MDQDLAKIIVQTYAILGLISATFFVLIGFAMILGKPILDSFGMLSFIDLFGAGMTEYIFTLLTILGVVLILLGAFEFYANIALWRHKEWARIMMIVNSVFTVLSVFTFPVGTIFGALGIYLFGFDATIKSLFVHVDPKIPVRSKSVV